MGGFQRPDAPAQPLQERHVVGRAAEKCLAQMDVSLDEAREDVGTAGVDRLVVWLRRLRADRRDTSVAHRHRSLHDVQAIVHGENGGVANQGRRVACHALYTKFTKITKTTKDLVIFLIFVIFVIGAWPVASGRGPSRR
jgi:hypothetical protein